VAHGGDVASPPPSIVAPTSLPPKFCTSLRGGDSGSPEWSRAEKRPRPPDPDPDGGLSGGGVGERLTASARNSLESQRVSRSGGGDCPGELYA